MSETLADIVTAIGILLGNLIPVVTGTLGAAWEANPLVTVFALGAGGYYFSLVRHPSMPCARCGGNNRRGLIFRRATGSCFRCHGKGQEYRPAARLLGIRDHADPDSAWSRRQATRNRGRRR